MVDTQITPHLGALYSSNDEYLKQSGNFEQTCNLKKVTEKDVDSTL